MDQMERSGHKWTKWNEVYRMDKTGLNGNKMDQIGLNKNEWKD